MTTLNDYLSAGRKALQQWRPQLEAVVRRNSEPLNKPATALEALPADWPPSLEKLLSQIQDLPEYSVLLGAGDDRLPFHLDLTNPASGAVLVCGDAQANLTGLMRSILASAVALNPPEQITLSVIARIADDYMDFSAAEACQEILPADGEIVSEFVIELAEIVEKRRSGRQPERAIVLFIDDLAECNEYLSEQAYSRLYWLIRHGPRYRVWTFASLPVERAHLVGARFLSAFRTRLIGHIKDNRMTVELSQDPSLRAGSLAENQFYLPYGSTWMRFWVCPTAGEESF